MFDCLPIASFASKTRWIAPTPPPLWKFPPPNVNYSNEKNLHRIWVLHNPRHNWGLSATSFCALIASTKCALSIWAIKSRLAFFISLRYLFMQIPEQRNDLFVESATITPTSRNRIQPIEPQSYTVYWKRYCRKCFFHKLASYAIKHQPRFANDRNAFKSSQRTIFCRICSSSYERRFICNFIFESHYAFIEHYYATFMHWRSILWNVEQFLSPRSRMLKIISKWPKKRNEELSS